MSCVSKTPVAAFDWKNRSYGRPIVFRVTEGILYSLLRSPNFRSRSLPFDDFEYGLAGHKSLSTFWYRDIDSCPASPYVSVVVR
ncbi:hypothetical protein MPTK1_2g15160 [Marchantia polymorpha subsp. ruderalis]|uniref:Uncharacterized protein n=1 Tax=Marchantia polymorpha TaxID=3197 RepID=A0A2R6WJW8_MARPO|nr:hypothetical protein MARPO_0082s0012 [Marchantia polymorpha]BBN02413.1 hypothetical protein Mp_2g15160 [Marchantia polymorpha subsp. ruderalis]|eukprot:PTQ34156.1 hypothetical protein MARPO_0082s0012 [Marchantia polymorpha]